MPYLPSVAGTLYIYTILSVLSRWYDPAIDHVHNNDIYSFLLYSIPILAFTVLRIALLHRLYIPCYTTYSIFYSYFYSVLCIVTEGGTERLSDDATDAKTRLRPPPHQSAPVLSHWRRPIQPFSEGLLG